VHSLTMKNVIFLVVFIAITPNSFARTPTVLTLDEALQRAMEHAPAIAGAKANIEISEAKERAAVSGWIPSLYGSASYNRQTGNFAPRPGLSASNFGGGSGFKYESTHKSYDYFIFGLNLTQTIWDSGRTHGNHQVAKAEIDVAKQDFAVTRLDVWANVTNRYFAVLANKQMVAVANRTAAQAKRHVDKSEAFVAAGLRPKIDAVRAAAEAHNAEAARLSAVDALVIAQAALAAAIGDPDLRLVDAIQIDFFADVSGVDVDEGYRYALANRPERSALAARVAVQEASVRMLKGRWYPAVAANASVNDSGMAVNELVWNWSVGITLTVPILSAVQTTFEVREASARLSKLRSDLDSMDLGIRLDVEQAAAAVNEASAKIQPILAALEAAREAFELAQARYDVGTGNSVELLDAQSAYANAQAAEVRARLDLELAYVAWHRAIGVIPTRPVSKEVP
jgi:outer membrane protein